MAFSLIRRAVSNGDVEEAIRLIDGDPQVVNATDELGHTLLFYASLQGHVSVVSALVDHGAYLDHQSRHERETALDAACCRGYMAVVKLLMDKGANPALPTNNSGRTPLMVASHNGHVGVVACLLQHPSVLSTINFRNSILGFTALFHACSRGHPDIVEMLVEAGADPTIQDDDEKTAMDFATRHLHQECVILLKEWDRSYMIAKARRLYDAFCHYQQGNASSSSSGGAYAYNKRPRMEGAIPTYLKGRVEGGQPLPKVEMVDGYEEGSLVESVLEYVIYGGLKGELFVEFMKLLGKTGYREEAS